MAVSFDIDEAQIVALFMECICFGVFLVTLVFCWRALLWSSEDHTFKTKINWPMLIVSLLFAIFATLDVAFGLRHNLDAFVYYTGPGGPKEELQDISYWVNVMKSVDFAVQTSIGDAMLVYRCYVVYGGNWRVIIPSALLWLGGTVCGILFMVAIATIKGKALVKTKLAEPFVEAMVSQTLVLTVVTTALIVYRIWSIDRLTSDLRPAYRSRRASKLKNVIRILVDSAALYTVSVIVLVCTYVPGNNAYYGTSDNMVQIIGISFNLIIIRVHSKTSLQSSEYDITQTGLNTTRHKPFPSFVYPLSTFQATVAESEGTATSATKAVPTDIEAATHQVKFNPDNDSGVIYTTRSDLHQSTGGTEQ